MASSRPSEPSQEVEVERAPDVGWLHPARDARDVDAQRFRGRVGAAPFGSFVAWFAPKHAASRAGIGWGGFGSRARPGCDGSGGYVTPPRARMAGRGSDESAAVRTRRVRADGSVAASGIAPARGSFAAAHTPSPSPFPLVIASLLARRREGGEGDGRSPHCSHGRPQPRPLRCPER